jgi:monoamine oxidase
LLDGQLTRRAFLGVAGAGVLAGTAAVPRLEASASSDPAKPRVVIVGSGVAGLGCAYRLWVRHGIRPEVYEYNTVPGGRIRTLRGHFADGQIVEKHAEFINPEHTATLAMARSFGLTLDNTDKYPPGGRFWQGEYVVSSSPEDTSSNEAAWGDWLLSQGFSEAEVRQLHERVAANDRPAPLVDHLRWLREVGFTRVDCTWRYLKFAVFGGWKPAADS